MSTVLKQVSVEGEFKRRDSHFRNWISADGSTGFKAERGRYHIYVSLACPWAHRTLIVRELKGLQDVISVSVVHWHLAEGGWRFYEGFKDDAEGKGYLRDLYLEADPSYQGSITVPTLWDKQKRTIVNNESSEIIRMLNSEFNEFGATQAQRELDLYPKALRADIDAINAWIYPQINNGVYRAGFARSQEAYEIAVEGVFSGLDRLEGILGQRRYLLGNQITEADVRLFTTLIRFDAVYVGHFKCNRQRLVDYKHLPKYLSELYQMPEFRSSVNFEHIKKHYYTSHPQINPFRIVPLGPDLAYLDEPHHRETLV